MVDQLPDCLDVLSYGDAQHPPGVEGKHHHDHNDGDGRTKRCLFEPDHEERVREFAQLLIELGDGDGDGDCKKCVADAKQIQAQKQGDQDERDRPERVVTNGVHQQGSEENADHGPTYSEQGLADLFARIVGTHEGNERGDYGPIEALWGDEIAQDDGGAGGDTDLDRVASG